MTRYQLKTFLARWEVTVKPGTTVRWPTRARGVAYCEGLANAKHEALLSDRLRLREQVYYPPIALEPDP